MSAFPINQTSVYGETDDVSIRQIEAMRRFREEIRGNDEPVPEFERLNFREITI